MLTPLLITASHICASGIVCCSSKLNGKALQIKIGDKQHNSHADSFSPTVAQQLLTAMMTSTPGTLVDGVETPSATLKSHHYHPHLHGAGKRIRHFLRPDGTKVHIAGNPDEARRINQMLKTNEKDNYELVIHGSPEHVGPLAGLRFNRSSFTNVPRSKLSATRTVTMKTAIVSSRRNIRTSLPTSSMSFAN